MSRSICSDVLLSVTLLLVPAMALAAEGRPWARYAEVHSIYAGLEAIPMKDRDRLIFQVRATADDAGSGADRAKLQMMTQAGSRAIPITPGGVLRFPVDAGLLRENPVIMTSLAVGNGLTLKPEIWFQPPASRRVGIAELMSWLDQANRGVRAQSGVWALFAPKARDVEMRFSDLDVRVLVETRSGTRPVPVDARGQAIIRPNAKMARAGDTVTFSAPMVAARPVFSGSMALRVDSDD